MSSLNHIMLAASFMAVLGITLAMVLAIANRYLYVHEDPRIDNVEGLLPHANCGACGTPGCRPFAEELVDGRKNPGECTVNSPEMNQEIADFLQVDVTVREKKVARLACSGGSHVAYTRAHYEGLKSCRAAALVSGGGKGCTWACLGLGDCKTVCDFDAIQMNKFSLPVVDEDKCTACGSCIEVCPKDLFSLQPISHRLWVSCNNRDNTTESEAHCEVACNGCGRCMMDAPEGLITIQDYLASIDYTKNALASKIAIERCPTGAIIWRDKQQGVIKGLDAKKIVRKEPLRRVMEPLPRA
ncbi:RnfABCDGE type electron transport complex subunit B [Candidatus Thiomargarita nelsonii]|uniref:Ion-translocating oxidoreductase complex subunit B n=1 Tax=Candidatus Thiomargarita nelsonii TaxID=1003181 RepID=A0A176S3U9_9GAMM|nr:RnfABCDGE type electron transport complex subunit B [Candidatus Thiomargarita nelsonii]